MRNVSDKSCIENQNTHFIFKFFFPEKHAVYEIMWKKYDRAGQATDDTMAQVHCMLDTYGYKHALRICNTYCSSTLKMVTLCVFLFMMEDALYPFSNWVRFFVDEWYIRVLNNSMGVCNLFLSVHIYILSRFSEAFSKWRCLLQISFSNYSLPVFSIRLQNYPDFHHF